MSFDQNALIINWYYLS